jgi:hypothetical protein
MLSRDMLWKRCVLTLSVHLPGASGSRARRKRGHSVDAIKMGIERSTAARRKRNIADLIAVCAHCTVSKWAVRRRSRLERGQLAADALSAKMVVLAALPLRSNQTSVLLQGEPSAASNQVDLSDAQAPVSHTDQGRGCALTHTSRDAGEPRVSRGERKAASPYAEGRVSSMQFLLSLAITSR